MKGATIRRNGLRARVQRAVTLLAVVAMPLAYAVDLPAVPNASATPTCGSGGYGSHTYNTGGESCYQVPAGVTAVRVTAVGAPGTAGAQSAGGEGGQVIADVAVTPGQVLYAEVGTGSPGGTGGDAGVNTFMAGGNGGGSSDIRNCPAAGTGCTGEPRLIVAGGGGGGGGATSGGTGGNGGGVADGISASATGVTNASSGQQGDNYAAPGSGGGAAAGTGGSAGGCGDGVNGSAGSGGAGGFCAGGGDSPDGGGGGGGGGGGFFGGGGGGGQGPCACTSSGSGGGGGSSYASPTLAPDAMFSLSSTGPSITITAPLGPDVCHTGGGSVSFAYTGAEECYTVPTGVATLQVHATGSPGQPGTDPAHNNYYGGSPGKGADVTSDLAVTPGQTLYVEVGDGGAGGLGGGAGGTEAGGNGGGSTDIRNCPADGTGCTGEPRLIVAGGGGGAGANQVSGGNAGGANPPEAAPVNGIVAGSNGDSYNGGGGQGGGVSAGGAGGAGGGSYECTASGGSANGAVGGSGYSCGSGGGGGGAGGFYGGGGGTGTDCCTALGGGGGGGSSYAAPSVTSAASFGLDTTGSPTVTITPLVVDHLVLSSGSYSSAQGTTMPGSLPAGTPLAVTVTAADAAGDPVPTYTGTVHFSSSDAKATLPADYQFTTGASGDNGTHSFSGISFATPGSQTLTVSDGTFTITVNLTVQAPLDSFNLARDFQQDVTLAAPANPFGPWQLFGTPETNNGASPTDPTDPSAYSPLTTYTTGCGGGDVGFSGGTVGGYGVYAPTTVAGGSCGTWTYPMGTVDLAPAGTGVDVGVTWTAPSAGVVDVTGSLWDNDAGGGNGILWYVNHGSSEVASGGFGNGGTQDLNTGQGSSSDPETGAANLSGIHVNAGDTITLIVDPNGDYSYDNTGAQLDISYDAYQNAILGSGGATSPAVYYRFNDLDGVANITDSANSPHSGAYASGITPGVPGALASSNDPAVTTGPSGGVGMVAALPASITGSGARTFEVWEKSTSVGTGSTSECDPSPNDCQALATWGDLSGSGTLFEPSFSQHQVAVWIDGQDAKATTAANLDDGSWHLIDISFDGHGAYQFFADGQSIGTDTSATIPLNTSSGAPMEIGSLPAGNYSQWSSPFIGSVDELAVYPSALDAASVAAHFAAAQPPTSPPPSTDTWSGQGNTANWSESANWAGGTAPGSTIDNVTFPQLPACDTSPAPASTCYVSNLDFPVAATGLAFSSGTANYVLGATGAGSLTTGSGGLSIQPTSPPPDPTTAGSVDITTPVALGADQTWTVADGESLAAGKLSGGHNLITDLSGQSQLIMAGDSEVSSFTATGSSANSGAAAGQNGTVSLLGAGASGINSANSEAVALDHVAFSGTGSLGALQATGANVQIDTLANPGALDVSSATMDGSTAIRLVVQGPASGTAAKAGTDNSVLQSTGPVDLGGGRLTVLSNSSSVGSSPACFVPQVGTVYTLVSAPSITGTFANGDGTALGDGATTTFAADPTCASSLNGLALQLHYQTTGTTQTVTGSVISTTTGTGSGTGSGTTPAPTPSPAPPPAGSDGAGLILSKTVTLPSTGATSFGDSTNEGNYVLDVPSGALPGGTTLSTYFVTKPPRPPNGTSFVIGLAVSWTGQKTTNVGSDGKPIPLQLVFVDPDIGAGGNIDSIDVLDSSGKPVPFTGSFQVDYKQHDIVLHFSDDPTFLVASSPSPTPPTTPKPLPKPAPAGYRLFGADGGVFAFGGAPFEGSGVTGSPASPVVASTATPDGQGYWLAQANGQVSYFGNASFLGSAATLPLRQPIVGMAATPDGGGYWLVASDGGVFAFGDAGFFGSTGGVRLNRPIVGMAATPDGGGYWLVASDGGVFAFGDAGFSGSTGGVRLNRPIVGMAATPDGGGYWLVASDGGMFAFGDAGFLGSAATLPLRQPIVGMAATPDGGGYWLVASDGGVFTYGDAAFSGSTAGLPLASPIVGLGAG